MKPAKPVRDLYQLQSREFISWVRLMCCTYTLGCYSSELDTFLATLEVGGVRAQREKGPAQVTFLIGFQPTNQIPLPRSSQLLIIHEVSSLAVHRGIW